MADDPTLPRPAKKPLLPRWVKFLLMLLGFLVGVAVLLWVIADISTRDSLEAEIAKLRAKGYPTTLEDLRRPEVPPEENAALVYEQAFAQLQPLDDKCWDILHAVDDPTEPGALEPEDLAYLEAHVAKNEKALALLHQAAQTPRCRFPVLTLSQRMAGASDPWPEVRQTTCVVTQGAMLVAVERGQGERALGYWLDSIALLRALEDHQSPLADLVRVACLEMSLRSLEVLLCRDLLEEAQLEQLLEALNGMGARRSVADSLGLTIGKFRSEFDSYVESMAGSTSLLRDSSKQPWQTWRTWGQQRALAVRNWMYATWLCRPVRQHDQKLLLSFLGKLVRLGEQPYYKERQRLSDLEQEAAEMPLYALVSKSGFLSFSPYVLEIQARHEALTSCARVAVALELLRKRTGEYPQTLDALIPDILAAIPIDPFDGQPVRYVRSEDRVAVYSIGENLQDDGGTEDPQRPREGDIVFTVRRAPAPTEETDDE